MTKEVKRKCVFIALLCLGPGFVFLARYGSYGVLLAALYCIWLVSLVISGFLYLKESGISSNTDTPIFDITLKQLGFRFSNGNKRWEIGGTTSPCMIAYYPSSSYNANLLCVYNFASANGEYMSKLVYSIEEIKFVFNACGITKDMIAEAQEKWLKENV